MEDSLEKPPSIGAGRPFPPPLPDLESYVVDFNGPDDPEHPFNWGFGWKVFTATIVCFGTFVASFNSAIFAPGIQGASQTFAISTEVTTLGTTLFVLGLASGPLIWGPASEQVGRRWPLIISMLGGGIFTIACAVAKDIQTLIICRMFAGLCGASPLSIVPAILSDLYNNTHRGMAITIYALTVFLGPFCAPFIGGFIAVSSLGWRWTQYIPALMSFANAAVLLLFLDETYAHSLLIAKAAALRRKTGNWGIHAAKERGELDLQALLRRNLTRPLRMLLTEPILLLVSMYMSFIYGLVYALLEAYPYVFETVYGMSSAIANLPFIGLSIGIVLACVFILLQHPIYARKLAANKNVPVPEWRLVPPLIGGPAFTAGLFWFGWTGFSPSIHWMAPTAAGVLIGFGTLCIFLPCFNYLVDAYLPLAASAVAANIMLRSAVAAGFPLFSKQMFANLGVQWAATLLGCLAAIMIPIPYAFRIYGPWLRERSRSLA